jgi:hypothetical protein
MRYAIITLNDNHWDLETDDLAEARKRFLNLKGQGFGCVIVEVLADTRTE